MCFDVELSQAFTTSTACYVQTWIYPAPPSQRLSTYNRLAIPALALGITAYGLVVYSGVGQLELLDWLLGFSWMKVRARALLTS